MNLGTYDRTGYACERTAHELRFATYLLGLPKTGKTTAIAHLAESFVAEGDGVVVIDTVGELSADLAGRTRHRGRLRYVAPGLHDWTLNPIEGDFAFPTQQDAAIGNILKLFERMGFGNLAVLTNVREWAINALYLSFALPHPTLSDVKRLLTDEDFRRPLYRWPHLNADVRDEWRAFDTLKPKGQQDLVGPLLGRLNTITKPAIFRRLMGNDGTPVALRRWLDDGDLVIIDVTQGLQGRTATTVANLVLAVLLGLTFARPPQSPHAWRIVCDEFHTFCDGVQVEELISQGRKRTVYPILSNHTSPHQP